MASTLKREGRVSLPSLPANRRSRGVLGLGSTLASFDAGRFKASHSSPCCFRRSRYASISASLPGQNDRRSVPPGRQRSQSADLESPVRKLHAKAIFNLRHEFNHFERSQQSGVKVICGQKLGSISLEFPAADKPGAQPFRSLFFQFVTHTGRHLSIAMQRTGEPSQPFNLSGRTTSSTSCDVRDFKLQMYSTSTTPAPSKTL